MWIGPYLGNAVSNIISLIQVWIQALIVGLSLKTLTIYRFYIIYIFYNPYLLLIILIIPSPPIQFTATQKIKREIRTPADADIWEYYLKDDDNGDNAQNRPFKPRLGKGSNKSQGCGLWGILDTGRIESRTKKPDRTSTIGLFVWRKSPGLIYGDNRAFPQRFFWYQAAIDGTHDSKCGKISSHRF